MREPRTTQLVLVPDWVDHPHAKELAAIGDVLDRNPEMARWVLADLVGDGQADRGAPA